MHKTKKELQCEDAMMEVAYRQRYYSNQKFQRLYMQATATYGFITGKGISSDSFNSFFTWKLAVDKNKQSMASWWHWVKDVLPDVSEIYMQDNNQS